MQVKLILGDSYKEVAKLEENSVDSIVCDPPYMIGFMGKEFDKAEGNIAGDVEFWKLCLRVLKAGGHLIAFGGTRTYHRMAVAIEDAGFEIRDMLEWIYNQGFPKSLNVGKGVDKRGGVSVSWFGKWLREWRAKENIPQKEIAKLFPSKTGGLTGCVANWELGLNMPTNEQFNLICEIFNLPFKSLEEVERKVVGINKNCGTVNSDGESIFGIGAVGKEVNITKGQSVWEGFGTALKPAHEPIILARKPLSEKTIVENVLKHGTGAIDIDGCRIPTSEGLNGGAYSENKQDDNEWGTMHKFTGKEFEQPTGRFPANLIVTDDALNDGVMTKSNGHIPKLGKGNPFGGENNEPREEYKFTDSGSKSRYFDIDVWAEKHGLLQFPKASKRERGNGNCHPTVKNIAVMSWLIRLVTPPDGTCLDPFMGSGTTGVACKILGRDFIGIEKEAEYYKISKARIENTQPDLFAIKG